MTKCCVTNRVIWIWISVAKVNESSGDICVTKVCFTQMRLSNLSSSGLSVRVRSLPNFYKIGLERLRIVELIWYQSHVIRSPYQCLIKQILSVRRFLCLWIFQRWTGKAERFSKNIRKIHGRSVSFFFKSVSTILFTCHFKKTLFHLS